MHQTEVLVFPNPIQSRLVFSAGPKMHVDCACILCAVTGPHSRRIWIVTACPLPSWRHAGDTGALCLSITCHLKHTIPNGLCIACCLTVQSVAAWTLTSQGHTEDESGRSLTGEKKCSVTQFPKKKPAGTPCVGGWQLAVGGGWWRLADVAGWGLVVDGGWQWLVVGSCSPLAVGGWWQLAVGGGWKLAVGGP